MSNLTDIRLVIFDWSGVISDDRLPVYESNGRMSKAYGVEREDFPSWLRNSKSSAHAYFSARGIHEDPAVMQEKYRATLEEVKKDGIHPVLYPDAVVTLQTLAQLHEKVFVVSMHPADHIKQEAEKYGVEKTLTGIIGGVTDKAEIIGKILHETGITAEHVAYVGDTLYDIQAAKKAGVMSVGITTGYHAREQLTAESPDLIVDSLTEFLTHLK